MSGKEIYKIYAREDTKWTEWIRPVPFVAIDTYNRKPVFDWLDRQVMFIKKYEKDTAIFVDMPGKKSIELGISLARLGYRPIPLFNGTDEQNGSQSIIDTYLIESCLINGAQKLKSISIDKNANPVFLLDSSRTNSYRYKETIFDNSWELYKQDIPTSKYFKACGIHKIIIVGDSIQQDLKKIFLEFQDAGMDFYLTDGYSSVKKIILRKTLRERLKKERL